MLKEIDFAVHFRQIAIIVHMRNAIVLVFEFESVITQDRKTSFILKKSFPSSLICPSLKSNGTNAFLPSNGNPFNFSKTDQFLFINLTSADLC